MPVMTPFLCKPFLCKQPTIFRWRKLVNTFSLTKCEPPPSLKKTWLGFSGPKRVYKGEFLVYVVSWDNLSKGLTLRKLLLRFMFPVLRRYLRRATWRKALNITTLTLIKCLVDGICVLRSKLLQSSRLWDSLKTSRWGFPLNSTFYQVVFS